MGNRWKCRRVRTDPLIVVSVLVVFTFAREDIKWGWRRWQETIMDPLGQVKKPQQECYQYFLLLFAFLPSHPPRRRFPQSKDDSTDTLQRLAIWSLFCTAIYFTLQCPTYISGLFHRAFYLLLLLLLLLFLKIKGSKFNHSPSVLPDRLQHQK